MSGGDTSRSASGSLIRAFASSAARKALGSLSTNQLNQRSNNEQVEEIQSVSSLDPNDDNLVMSTRHNFEDDSRLLPKMRSTAQKYGRYSLPEPQPRITTSAVRGHFQDFDQDEQSSDEYSIEVGRGHKGSAHNTPSKINSDLALNIGNSSLWEVTGTPPVDRRPRPTARKSDGIERGSLRRDAQKRAASTNYNLANFGRPGTRVSPAKKGAKEQHRSGVTSNYEQFTENIDDSYYYGGHPNATADEPPSTVKPARYSTQHNPVAVGTPSRRNTVGTPRSAPNATVESFALPEIPGMTELISGIRQDGTPIFSRSGKPRSKYSSRRVSAPLLNFVPVESVPMPEEEKQIIAQLQVLKEKLSDLEQEKEEADMKIEDYEQEIAQLREQLDAQDRLRRTDSGLGPSDGENGSDGKVGWKAEKIRLETSVTALQTRLGRFEVKASKAERMVNRLTKERDHAAEQLAAACLTQKELEAENETLRNDNQLLRAQIEELQNKNARHLRERDQLIAELDMSTNRHHTETQQLEEQLRAQASKAEKVLEAENRNLRERLDELQSQYEEETKQLTQRESKALRDAQKGQAERQKLEEEKQRLLDELAEAKAERQAEMKRWNREQRKLEARVQDHEDTIHELQDAPPKKIANETVHEEIGALKEEIAALRADRDYETVNGTVREKKLERQLQRAQAEHEQASLDWVRKEDLLRAELEQEREKSRHSRKVMSKDEIQSVKVRGRSRSKSVKRGRKSSISIRRVSEPIPASAVEVEDAVSETDSTTDLSPFLSKQRKSFNKSQRASASLSAGDDLTYLSPIQTQDVREIRRKIEEERLKGRVVSAFEPVQKGTREATMSGGLPKKSSLKDLTGRSIASNGKASAAEAEATEPESSESEDELPPAATRSRSKSTNRRRSSAGFSEMTSAFILPDITLYRRGSQSHPRDITQAARPTLSAEAKDVLSSLAPGHDVKNCTICARLTNPTAQHPEASIKIPLPIPISTRPEHASNPDATLRPTEPPLTALARVLKTLYDEHAHLVLRLHTEQHKLATLDPAATKREREAVHDAIDGLNRAVRIKAEQIYGLYDVVEAHKAELGPEEAEEIDRTLEEVRRSVGRGVGDAVAGKEQTAAVKGMAARGTKKVVVESFHDSEDRIYGRGEDGDELEVTWEGLTKSSFGGGERSRSRGRSGSRFGARG